MPLGKENSFNTPKFSLWKVFNDRLNICQMSLFLFVSDYSVFQAVYISYKNLNILALNCSLSSHIFNVCKFYNDVAFFIPDIGYFCLLFFFFLCVSAGVYPFYWFLQRNNFGFIFSILYLLSISLISVIFILSFLLL